MTLVTGKRCRDRVALAADRRRFAKSEIGPEATKLVSLNCKVSLTGAGDDTLLNEAL